MRKLSSEEDIFRELSKVKPVEFLKEEEKKIIEVPSFVERYVDSAHVYAVENFNLNEKFYRKVGLSYLLHKDSSQDLLKNGKVERFAERLENYHLIREHIAESNWSLFLYSLRKTLDSERDKEEFFSECLLTYTSSIDSYNPFAGCKFSTYLFSAIFKRIGRMRRDLKRRNGREVHKSNFAYESSTDLKRTSDETDFYIEKIEKMLSGEGILSDREKMILNERFFREKKVTLIEIGKKMGLTRERVRQLQFGAFEKMRRRLGRNHF